MAEEVAAVVGWEVVEDGADAVPESGNGSLGGSSQMRFDFCKRLLDRIEVGRVRMQEEQACACGFDHDAYFVALACCATGPARPRRRADPARWRKRFFLELKSGRS